jgi:hypothetical protein
MSSRDIFRCISRKMFLPKSHMTRINIQFLLSSLKQH